MEFFETKQNGYGFNVIYVGSKYVFFNAWCGIAAIAERTTPTAEIDGAIIVNIKYGNAALVGGTLAGKAILPLVKRLVNKVENRYVPQPVIYTSEEIDLCKYHAEIAINQLFIN